MKSAAVAVLMTSLPAGFGQNFTNLNFEAANHTGYPPGSDIPVSAALPGWTVTFSIPSTGTTNNLATMWYDNISLSGAAVSVNDTNTGFGFVPLQGRYSAYLFGGPSGAYFFPTYVTISQTGMVPAGTLSMTMEVNALEGFSVAINGQNLYMVPLSVHSSPRYIVFGSDLSAFAGQTVQLSITAPPTAFPPDANSVLLDNIIFSSAPLSYPPVILAPPTNQTAVADSTVAFSVTASGYTPLSYQWLFKGSNYNAQATNSVLVLSNVLAPVAGGYSVIISNSYGSVTSQVAMLTVRDPFITNGSVSPSGPLHAGQTLNLNVAAVGSMPLSYQWLENGAALTNGGHITGAETTMLTLSNISGADSGLYSVVVSNPFGSVTNSLGFFSIEDPYLVSGPASQTVNIDSTASFGVMAGGTAPLYYQWYDAGAALNDAGNISGSHTATLTLSNVMAGDADVYYAVVSNVFGSVTSSVAFVSVVPPAYSVLNTFTNNGGGSLVVSSNMLYGTIPGGSNGVFSIDTQGSNFTALHTFTGSDGGDPGVLLTAGSTLFGTTILGGGTNNDGTVFRMNTDGSNFATLHTFNGSGDGAYPSNLILSDGTLYGTAGNGGSGNGTVFKLTTDGSNFQVLATFTASNGNPSALVASAGMLYGLTVLSAHGGYTSTLYQIDTNGNQYAQVAQLQGAANPPIQGGLLLAGTTLYGIASSPGFNNGAIFRINTDGSGQTVLKTFAPGMDGYYPVGNLILNGAMLYGTTQSGGISNNGTMYRINTNGGDFTVLKRFRGGSDGAWGAGSLALSGNTLYGVTLSGGTGAGVLFSYSLQTLAGTMTPPALIPRGYQLGFFGIPGLPYSVQRAPLITGPWTTFTNVAVGSGGMATFQDTNAPFGGAFYRTKYP